jgi:hypothetical protein
MDKYEKLVRQIAQEMVRSDFPHLPLDDFPEVVYDGCARNAIKHMAEQFEEGYYQSALDHGAGIIRNDPDVKRELIERGLIPSLENVADDNQKAE